jgi:hypothetical protein
LTCLCSAAPGDKKGDKAAEEPLTNEKIWDRVLASHPEQDDLPNSDLLYEYSRKARRSHWSYVDTELTLRVWP